MGVEYFATSSERRAASAIFLLRLIGPAAHFLRPEVCLRLLLMQKNFVQGFLFADGSFVIQLGDHHFLPLSFQHFGVVPLAGHLILFFHP